MLCVPLLFYIYSVFTTRMFIKVHFHMFKLHSLRVRGLYYIVVVPYKRKKYISRVLCSGTTIEDVWEV